MTTSLFPWQASSWQQLQQLRPRLPHALLFYGAEGIGKTAFAERFAHSLLCQAPLADGQPCGQCEPCRWFVQYSHPDYRRVRPEVLEDGDTAEDDGEAGETKKNAKSAKAPSKEIKIDQIRALSDFMNVSTHRQGKRVILLYPAEALNTAAANALLKTLEEPPPDTLFLLVCDSLDRLLPTILSRCRKFAMPMPSYEVSVAWFKSEGIADADIWLAEQGGAPLAAKATAQEVDIREKRDELIRLLAHPGVEAALRAAEKLQKANMADMVDWVQRWVYDVFSFKLSGRIRYYPRYRTDLAALAERAETADLMQALKSINERRAVADHPLSARLFIEDMLLEYSSFFRPGKG